MFTGDVSVTNASSKSASKRNLWLYIPKIVALAVLLIAMSSLALSWPPVLVPINPAVVPIAYEKLAEQYGSFLVAIGGVSITALALVMTLWHVEKVEDKETMHNRSAVIKALIVATFCSFVGAHLLAETAAFIAGGAEAKYQGGGARQFLLASVNIFVAVPVVMFAITVLATEFRKKQELVGLRLLSSGVFTAVVFCVLWWMIVSIFFRMSPRAMPPQIKFGLIGLVLAVATLSLVLYRSLRNRVESMAFLLNITFALITLFSIASLIFCSRALYSPGDDPGLMEAGFFVSTVTFTCLALSTQDPSIARKTRDKYMSTLQQCQ
jgi:hypothetical protein